MTIQEMFFDQDYAGGKRRLRIIYIQYQDGFVHDVIAESNGVQVNFDFEKDCRGEIFMYYNSGSGGSIKKLQPPHYTKRYKGGSYWIHSDAKFKSNAINCKQINDPILFNEDPNPFNNGRQIYQQNYCKFCKKWYDENLCYNHHVINNGELHYYDGSKAD